MTTVDSPATASPVRLLIFAKEHNSANVLLELLSRIETLEATHVSSREETLALVNEQTYAMLLWIGDAQENASDFETIAQNHPEVPAVFLQDGDGRPDLTQIQTALCSFRRGCNCLGTCAALAVLSAIDAFCKERQRRCAEQTLSRLRQIVEQSPNPIMISDQAGTLEYVNPAFETLTGYSRDEVLGRNLDLLQSEQQAGELYEQMWNTVKAGQVFRGIVMNRKKSGETFTIEKTITPLRDSSGQITHFITAARDLTEQRKLEAELRQSQKMDAIGRLAGGVAHDFNNLLMVISAYAELMLDTFPEGHALRANVGEIITAARRAADLTRQLLAFGRKQLQSLQLLDLNLVVADISRMLPRLLGEDIQLIVSPGCDLGRVKADPVQIEQIIMNLAANARDAMPRGGILTIETASVRLDKTYVQRHSIVPPGDYVLLAVTDSGQGIPQEHMAHIFEPFYTTKEEGKGTGLGLATVYGIVKQTGGFIWVYSEVGLGTTFKIYLPRIHAKHSTSAPAKTVEHVQRGNETILLVEDENAVRQSTREFLTVKGYTVLEATNGEEALRISREYCGAIDLMISDVVMPKMGGAKLAEQLSAERPNMKVLFVSGYAEATVLRHGTIDVTTRFLQKPFSLRDLSCKIRETLALNAQARAARSAN